MSLRDFMDSPHSLFVKVESMTPQASYATNGVGFAFGAVTFNQWVMGITLVLGVLTFIVNLYFQYRRSQFDRAKNEREKELHLLRVKSIQEIDRAASNTAPTHKDCSSVASPKTDQPPSLASLPRQSPPA